MDNSIFGIRFWFDPLFGIYLNIKIYRKHTGWSFYLSTERIYFCLSRFYFSTGLDNRPRIIPYKRIFNIEAMYLLFKPKDKDKSR